MVDVSTKNLSNLKARQNQLYCPFATEESPSASEGGSQDRDRFHLLLGVCVEALSNTRSNLTRDQVLGCLKSLAALLDHGPTRQEVLAQEPALLVELCNVLHRTVLTRPDSPAVQVPYLQHN